MYDAYIMIKGTITVVGTGDTAAAWQTDRNNKRVLLKYCAPLRVRGNKEHISRYC